MNVESFNRKISKPVILASASPRRKELLAGAGIDFDVYVSNAEENSNATHPGLLAQENAVLKARAVGQALGEEARGRLIVSADTVVALEGEVLGKPKDEEDAVRMLMQLSGKSHEVFTGVCVVKDDIAEEFYECTRVNMKPFTEEEARAYVATGEPMDKAGSYGIQGLGGALVKSTEGDFNNVVGFPVDAFLAVYKRIL